MSDAPPASPLLPPDAPPTHRLGYHAIEALRAAAALGDPTLVQMAEQAAVIVGFKLARDMGRG